MKKILFILIITLTALAGCKKNDPEPEPPGPGPKPGGTYELNSFVRIEPDFPVANEEMTIYFNLAKGNAALKGTNGTVYVHTGILSSSGGWDYVKNDWNVTPSSDARLEKVDGDVYKISFTPTQFYGANSSVIGTLAFVLRDAGGNVVGRNADGGDIFVPVYQAGNLYAKLETDDSEPVLDENPLYVKNIGAKIKFNALASLTADLKVLVNDEEIESKNSVESISFEYQLSSTGLYTFELTATNSGKTATSKISYLVNGGANIEELPEGVGNGITVKGNTVYFVLTAPGKSDVYLIGDFNNYEVQQGYAMNKTPDGKYWWLGLTNLDTSKEYTYQYIVDGALRIADPYCELVLDPNYDNSIPSVNFSNIPAYPSGKTTGIVSYTQFTVPEYQWSISAFNRPDKENLVIYEVLIRDFVARNNFKTLADTIGYFKNMGVNCIELMPVNEFEANSSWGYNPSFYFAPDKYYGTKNELKTFIDICHQNGIAVVIDMVLNHSYGESPMVQLYWDTANNRPSSASPWFNPLPTHPYNVGYDFNHESDYTKEFVKNVVKFWLEEYKIDGFRFDLSKGFTQNMTDPNEEEWGKKDDSRIAIWKDYNGYIKSVSSDAYVILEHFAWDEEEVVLADDGMMLWSNLNWDISEVVQGHNANLSRLIYKTHGSSTKPYWVNYMECHDLERVMWRALNYGQSNGTYNVKNLATAAQRIEMAAALLVLSPGPTMLWQFGELGYDVSIDEGGRLSEKPLKWEYLNVPERLRLKNNYAKIIRLKTGTRVTNTSNFSYNLANIVKYIKLESSTNTVMVYANTGMVSQSVELPFGIYGNWYNYMTGETEVINSNTVSLAPGEYKIMSLQPIVIQ